MQSIEQVKEFHEVFNHVIAPAPCIPDEGNNRFRQSFILEELAEVSQALAADDVVLFADGLADIQYVLDGWFLNAGLLKYKDAIMEEVHRSNMSKVCKTRKEAEDTIESLQDLHDPEDEVQTKYIIDPVGDYFIVKRAHDGKVMKSINYSKPDIACILNKKL